MKFCIQIEIKLGCSINQPQFDLRRDLDARGFKEGDLDARGEPGSTQYTFIFYKSVLFYMYLLPFKK